MARRGAAGTTVRFSTPWVALAGYRCLVATRGESDVRSPLKSAPVRVAGQGLQEEIERVRADDVGDTLVMVAITLVLFAFAIINFFTRTPPGVLVVMTGLFFVGSVFWAFPKLRRARQKIGRLKQGLAGERAVAEYLDTLRDDRFRVLHDVQGVGFNVDHVLVGPQGVFTIETKTIRKPVSGMAQISYDGEHIRIGRFEPSRDPVVQARAEASWLRQLLQESTGKRFSVRPVVVFPGWFVEQPTGLDPLVWVLEPKMLRARLLAQPVFMSDEDINLCVFHLKRFIRQQ